MDEAQQQTAAAETQEQTAGVTTQQEADHEATFRQRRAASTARLKDDPRVRPFLRKMISMLTVEQLIDIFDAVEEHKA